MSLRTFLSSIALILLVVAGLVANKGPFALAPTPQDASDLTCRVQKVTDGDTLRCADGTRIRLHAISARETDNSCSPGHPCASMSADQSTQALKTLVQGKTLDCMSTGETYNRISAICWTPEDVEVNCHMVETGAAALWERYDDEVSICRKITPRPTAYG